MSLAQEADADGILEARSLPRARPRLEGEKRHTLSVLVANRFGVLARVSAIFARRALNMESLQYKESEDCETASMSLSFSASEPKFRSVVNDIRKLIDVIQVKH